MKVQGAGGPPTPPPATTAPSLPLALSVVLPDGGSSSHSNFGGGSSSISPPTPSSSLSPLLCLAASLSPLRTLVLEGLMPSEREVGVLTQLQRLELDGGSKKLLSLGALTVSDFSD